ncbi:hypothetical protein BC826DRAFT_453406 [Russula brevipes]|nr:hypothetical protein BC826DRAFT_453406 [Russula brevipes]
MNTPQATVSIPRFVAFESGERESAVAVFVFALLSTLVLSLVLLCVAWVVFSTTFKRTTFQHLSREAFFFRSQLGQYATCLLLSNWLRGVSGSFDIQWVNAGGVKAGPSCTAQGALRQIGQFGSFFFIVAMGIHTFNTLVLHNRQPQWLGIVVTFVGWSSAILIGVAPLSNSSRVSGPLYYIDGFTCGISKAYQVSHMLLYFLPLFLACLLSAIVYSLVFLMLRGTLVLNGGLRIHFGLERKLRLRNGTFEEYQRFIVSVSRTMLWLPISFVLALFPSSIVQLMDISGIAVSPGAMAFSYILEHLDSVINVLILFKVLRALGFAMKSTMSTDSEKGRSERGTISRPIYDWKPESKFAPATGPVTAPPAPPPFSITEESVIHPATLAKSLFQTHKKALISHRLPILSSRLRLSWFRSLSHPLPYWMLSSTFLLRQLRNIRRLSHNRIFRF